MATMEEMVKRYKEINDTLKMLEKEKNALRDLLPIGTYAIGGIVATVSESNVRKVNTRALFSHLLRKGKMGTFLDASSVSMKALEENGVPSADFYRFTEPSHSFKTVRVR